MDAALWNKIFVFLNTLNGGEKIVLYLTALGFLIFIIAPLWAWAHKRGTRWGRQEEQLHGLVPRLRLELDNMRHETIRLESRYKPYIDEISVKQQEIESLKSGGAKLPEDIERLLNLRDQVAEQDFEVWNLRERQQLPHLRERLIASRTKILTVGNLKGGVGKTTLSSNLAAFFDKHLNKRVLLIDLDYQGSLSATALRSIGAEIGKSLAEFVLSGEADGEKVVEFSRQLSPVLDKTRIIPASISLQSMEDRLMVRWLFHVTAHDIRFNLAKVLLSDNIQNNFDVVILDVGPRLTTASVSALMASTHLIVPTNLDRLSVETVETMLSQARRLKEQYGLALELAGVVGTMTYRDKLTNSERDAHATISEVLNVWWQDAHIFKRTIPRRQALAKVAGEGIGYLLPSNEGGRDIRSLFGELGQEIAQRIDL